MKGVEAAAGARSTAADSWTARLPAYKALAKLDFFDFYLNVPVAWTLLPAGLLFDWRVFVGGILLWPAEVCIVAAIVALDDLQGYRDGSDRLNYSRGTNVRGAQRKPLLDGRLTPRQATRFAILATVTGTVLLTLAAWVAPHRPIAVLVAVVVVMVAGLQYSWALKLSYIGAQEILIAGGAAALVILPFGFVTGGVTDAVVVEGALFGLWMLLVSVYSNTHDADVDRAVGRINVAARASRSTNRRFIVVLTAWESALIVTALISGVFPWWFSLALAPLLFVRGRQVLAGIVNDDPLVARRIGILAHRVGVAGLVVGNLWALR